MTTTTTRHTHTRTTRDATRDTIDALTTCTIDAINDARRTTCTREHDTQRACTFARFETTSTQTRYVRDALRDARARRIETTRERGLNITTYRVARTRTYVDVVHAYDVYDATIARSTHALIIVRHA